MRGAKPKTSSLVEKKMNSVITNKLVDLSKVVLYIYASTHMTHASPCGSREEDRVYLSPASWTCPRPRSVKGYRGVKACRTPWCPLALKPIPTFCSPMAIDVASKCVNLVQVTCLLAACQSVLLEPPVTSGGWSNYLGLSSKKLDGGSGGAKHKYFTSHKPEVKLVPHNKLPKPIVFHDSRIFQKLTPLTALLTLLWIPVSFVLSCLRIAVGILLPIPLIPYANVGINFERAWKAYTAALAPTSTKESGNFGLVVDMENELCFRHYLVNPVGVARSFYPSKEVEVEPNTVVEARIVGALWALPGEISAFDDMTLMWILVTYNSQIVALQLGYDQGVPNPPQVIVEEICNRFLIRNNRALLTRPAAGLSLPARDRVGRVSPRWLDCWSQQLENFRPFVCSKPSKMKYPHPYIKIVLVITCL
ncbi:hypothetical protein Acr_15g0002720 [Actinidia rufa]|uniref:Uncharacterized protein n=1 Tax=Actinidia rufa TaxID=165716 RepID=A0A7J0FSK4_9ERIC|nr:hypothetical protein Acr_15g0002720 [Actinidia rufa]